MQQTNQEQPEHSAGFASGLRRSFERFRSQTLLAGVLLGFALFAASVYAFVGGREVAAPTTAVDAAVNSSAASAQTDESVAMQTNDGLGATNTEQESAVPSGSTTTQDSTKTDAASNGAAASNAASSTESKSESNAGSSAGVNNNTAASRPANTNTAPSAAPAADERDTQPIEQYTAVMTVQGTGGATTYNVSVPVGATVADLMALARAQGLSYTTKQFGGLGAYVNNMNGLSEDTNAGMYWVYRINNVKATAGISTKKLNRGDSVQWRYEREQ